MKESIEQFKNLSKQDQKEVLDLIKLKNDFKEQETKRKVKKYDEILEYLKKHIKLCDSDIKEFEKNKNIYFEQISILKATKEIYQEILTKMEEGK